MLEESSDAIRVLKQRLGKAEAAAKGLQAARDEVIAKEAECGRQRKEYERLIANANKILKDRKADGTLACHAESFSDLEAWFADQPSRPQACCSKKGTFWKPAVRRSTDCEKTSSR